MTRSGLVKSATDRVKRDVTWPHHFVFRTHGSERVPATYSQLTMAEFMHGFAMGVLEERDHDTQVAMFRYLAHITREAARAPWTAVKDCHAAILHEMETGSLTWHHDEELRAMRLELISRATPTPERKVCGFCLRTTGDARYHPEDKCHKKAKAQKIRTIEDKQAEKN